MINKELFGIETQMVIHKHILEMDIKEEFKEFHRKELNKLTVEYEEMQRDIRKAESWANVI